MVKAAVAEPKTDTNPAETDTKVEKAARRQRYERAHTERPRATPRPQAFTSSGDYD
jgi:hypothetical protein